MIRGVCLIVLFLPLVSQAQFTYTLDQTIPVQDTNGGNLSFPWAGGLNSAQFNTMDLNGDGAEDLVLFDRMANKVITFLSSDNRYVPAPDFESLFPDDVSNWLLLRDYNCDGKKDIFTSDVLGIKVFRNVTSSPGRLEWEQHLFSTGYPGPKSGVLLTLGNNDKVNLQLQYDDLPSISDLDGDGDLDILNIRYAGHTVEFHQNLSMENNLPCDSLEFKRITRTWGDFRECQCGVFAFNSTACPPNSGGRTEHAGGKSLLAIDVDGDAQQDLLFSEAECSHLLLLLNEGTTSTPVIPRSSVFPTGNPANFIIFPAAYHEDVDFDGRKDLIATPNIFNKEFLNTNLHHSTWFYKNTGTSSNPAFSLVAKNFLQGQMVDIGDNAVPAFADFNSDGDLDLFVSTHSSTSYTSRIYLFENTGSQTSPAFKLLSDDFLGFQSSRFFNLKIQFADLDTDETLDLVFTATSFDDGVTRLYYLNNPSQTRLDFSGTTLRQIDFQLTNTENVYVTDVNGDGLPDILAGRSEGNLEYWKHDGIQGVPRFVLEEDAFLGLSATPMRQNLACAVADLDADGFTDLAIGDQAGRLGIISNFLDAGATVPEPDHNLVYNAALETYGEKNLGGKIWPAVANLFNTNKPSVVVGNVLGGIHILRHDEGTSLPEDPNLNVFPNPVSRSEVLNVQADRYGTLEVISVLGQRLSPPIALRAQEVKRYSLPPLAAGLYFLRFTANNRSRVQRLVIR
jgi:hypothetical protein